MKIKVAPNGNSHLNLGCGVHFSEDWNNLDTIVKPGVDYFDVSRPLPFPDQSFDVTYSSHVLEHLGRDQGRSFLAEQFRVLKVGGICRVVVPDLERICRDYLAQLEKVTREPSAANELDYDWGVIQLIDQLTRLVPGGETRKAMERGAYDEAFLRSRFGDEILPPKGTVPPRRRVWSPKPGYLLRKAKSRFLRLIGIPLSVRETGEVHRWMYDRHSLHRLLGEVGFGEIEVVSHTESRIRDWDQYRLDLSLDGVSARKPDSIFVEARRI